MSVNVYMTVEDLELYFMMGLCVIDVFRCR